jgi:pyruvate/2-oxoglutarate dehydrogenase complex dihydrolipoamide dehydrogenase (E3) component
VVSVAALAMAAELTVEDLARLPAWHPSPAEALVSTARELA